MVFRQFGHAGAKPLPELLQSFTEFGAPPDWTTNGPADMSFLASMGKSLSSFFDEPAQCRHLSLCA
jgi:hypothetical protein